MRVFSLQKEIHNIVPTMTQQFHKSLVLDYQNPKLGQHYAVCYKTNDASTKNKKKLLLDACNIIAHSSSLYLMHQL